MASPLNRDEVLDELESLVEHAPEMRGMGAVDHVVGRAAIGLVVNLLDGLVERLTAG